ncbi:MAG: Rieske 2Fe-2S domain-containing protein [Pseudomonadales bacterium]|nr:Rieske 2Fe-2S domain-containing protein [Pseudomonadales bacterium]
MAYQTVCAEGSLEVGTMTKFKLDGTNVLLYRLEDGYYATQRRCSHMRLPLDKGTIDGDIVQCPIHRARFNIKSGEVDNWASFPPGIQICNVLLSEKALKTFPVKVENGQVHIDVKEEALESA